ncbi:2-hydroxyacid dehydrogenase [Chachezhania sediminis]|uniref:2-hydroxyacid dehydrogenase n=1 Tax=Chachezhania sediminis TaxID=2599291 RepID=UPI0018EECED4|nr:D-glycerate dehydrogenase [Chachezhania sediminis]
MSDKKTKVMAALELPASVEAELASRFDFRKSPVTRMTRDQTLESAKGYPFVIVAPGIGVDRDFFARLPQIRALGTYSVGLDHVDLVVAKELGIPVLNTPDVLTDATADVGMLLLLGASRRAREATAMIRNRDWPGWSPTQLTGPQLKGRVLGIFGMGRIGRAIAERARGFGMRIAYHNRSRLTAELEQGAAFFDTKEALFDASDMVMIAAPGTRETAGIVNADLIGRLKPGGVLVNISRGDLVVDDDLIAALESGHLFAAGLDVFKGEPDFDPRYAALPNVFATPHIGSATVETRHAMGMCLVDGIAAIEAGEEPFNLVR